MQRGAARFFNFPLAEIPHHRHRHRLDYTQAASPAASKDTMGNRKKQQGRERRLKKFLRRLPPSAEPQTDEQIESCREVERAVAERFNLPGLADDMEELRQLKLRIAAALQPPLPAAASAPAEASEALQGVAPADE